MVMSMKADNSFLSAEELVARYKGKIKKSTLANWRCVGKGPPHIKLEGRVLYPLDRVQEWEQQRLKK
jgi:hypothetical protein